MMVNGRMSDILLTYLTCSENVPTTSSVISGNSSSASTEDAVGAFGAVTLSVEVASSNTRLLTDLVSIPRRRPSCMNRLHLPPSLLSGALSWPGSSWMEDLMPPLACSSRLHSIQLLPWSPPM